MTRRDEIIEMAGEAGAVFDLRYKGEVAFISKDALERFAALVAKEERERCAQECYDISIDNYQTALGSNSGMYDHRANGAEECAEAIRALGDEQ